MSRACKEEPPGNGYVVPSPCPLWKRGLDLCLIILALPMLVPLVVLISLWILLVSGTPILFKQQRIGYLGRPFTCFKFRTMRAGVDTTAHRVHAQHLIERDLPMIKLDSKGDSRLILFASVLRSSGLDELPQLINVLRGEMSVVGPRPCLPCELEKYLPWQRERFNAAPGLTGLWQVSGKNKTTFVEMIRLDIDYARMRTLGLDVKIILKTIPVLILQFCETHRIKKSYRNQKRQTTTAALADAKSDRS